MDEKMKQCYGCEGKGWVDSKHLGPTICPICKGSGQLNNEVLAGELITRLPLTSPPSTIRRKSDRYWAFCEAIDLDGGNLKRYPSSTECWREETGLALKEGYTGKQNRDAVDSFRNQGWGVVFGEREHKEKGMRVIRPPKS